MIQLYKDLYLTALTNEIGLERPLVDMHRILNKYTDVLDSDEEEMKSFLNSYVRKGMWDELRSSRLYKSKRP
jgi:hypothetical protein